MNMKIKQNIKKIWKIKGKIEETNKINEKKKRWKDKNKRKETYIKNGVYSWKTDGSYHPLILYYIVQL